MSDEEDTIDMSLLSDAEREAIEEESEEQPVEDEQPAEETEAEPEAEPEPEPEPEPEERAELPPDDRRVFTPEYQAQDISGINEAFEAIDKQYEEAVDKLAEQYESGDLSFSEYRKQDRALSRDYESKRAELHEYKLKAEIAYEHNRQSLEQKWKLEQELFFEENPSYKDDALLRGALGAQLDVLYADEKLRGRSGLWYLREAAKTVDARFGLSKAAAPSSLQEAEKTLKKREANRPTLPKTLSETPTAADNLETGDEFARLDKLSGLDYERALASLSEADRERYLASA